jgi:hypothetical protein
MSVNKYKRHVLVLPEDDANRQLANGFVINLDGSALTKVQVLEEAGGWSEVLSSFKLNHLAEMDRYPDRFIVLLIDFDCKARRLAAVKHRIPEQLTDRVFILGAWSTPEKLRHAGLGSYEEIGSAMAQACRADTEEIWGHPLLEHNASELSRLRKHVRPILFQ